MTRTTARSPVTGSSVERAIDWRSQLPVIAFGFVILCLLTLAVTPIVMVARLDELRHVTNSTIGAARPIAGDLRVLFVEEEAAHERYRVEGDTSALAKYRTYRREEEALFARLTALAGNSDRTIAFRVEEMEQRAAHWHALPDAAADGRMSRAQLLAAGERVVAGRDSVMASSALLRDELNRTFDRDGAKGTAILNTQRIVSITLGLVALVTTFAVALFAQRERRLSRELARAVAEEGRLRGESERRREELERITATKTRLIRGFTHDVKNPIGAADGYLQLLLDDLFGPLGDKQRTSIARAHRSLIAALDLIGDLLQLATAEAGHIEVRRLPTHVGDLASDVVEEYRAQAEAKGLTVVLDCAEGVPILDSDPARVRQVLGNLMSNAVKYTRAGSVAVRVRAIAAADRPAAVTVAVTDTGGGIPADKQHLLFREFVRLDPDAGPGAGIGLAISDRIIDALGGSIAVSSELGRGTTFTVSLPLGDPGPGDEPRPDSADPAGWKVSSQRLVAHEDGERRSPSAA